MLKTKDGQLVYSGDGHGRAPAVRSMPPSGPATLWSAPVLKSGKVTLSERGVIYTLLAERIVLAMSAQRSKNHPPDVLP